MTETRTFRAKRATPSSVTLTKGLARYEVDHSDGGHCGWVCRHDDGTWVAYAVEVDWRDGEPTGRGRLVESGARIRVDAVLAVLFDNYQHDRITREAYDEAVDDSWYEPEPR